MIGADSPPRSVLAVSRRPTRPDNDEPGRDGAGRPSRRLRAPARSSVTPRPSCSPARQRTDLALRVDAVPGRSLVGPRPGGGSLDAVQRARRYRRLRGRRIRGVPAGLAAGDVRDVRREVTRRVRARTSRASAGSSMNASRAARADAAQRAAAAPAVRPVMVETAIRLAASKTRRRSRRRRPARAGARASTETAGRRDRARRSTGGRRARRPAASRPGCLAPAPRRGVRASPRCPRARQASPPDPSPCVLEYVRPQRRRSAGSLTALTARSARPPGCDAVGQ